MEKGRILRLKAGYNPNSSSVGSQVPVFFALALGSGAITVLALEVIAAFERRIKGKEKDIKPQ